MTDGGNPTGGDLGDLFSQLQSARADLEAHEEAIESTVVEGHAADGAVVIQLTGGLEVASVHLDRSIVDSDDVELLEDAVFAALRDALGQVMSLRAEAVSAMDAGLGGVGALGGVDLASLVGNLDLSGMLGGVDLDSVLGGGDLSQLMGSLGLGGQLSGGPGAGAATEAGDPDGDAGGIGRRRRATRRTDGT